LVSLLDGRSGLLVKYCVSYLFNSFQIISLKHATQDPYCGVYVHDIFFGAPA